jgi:DsbC/DsbD-like thiol-disulfide interchange protein
MIKCAFFTVVSSLMLAGMAALPARAQIVPKDVSEVVTLELLPGWREADGVHIAALRFELAPGWKTFWRAPGDGGIPTRIAWDGSRNLADVQMIWPRPKVFRLFGLRSIGYTDTFVLPIHLEARKAGPISVSAVVDFGVCDEICLPVRMRISGKFASGGAPDPQIMAALESQPRLVDDVAMRCDVTKRRNGADLRVTLDMPQMEGSSLAAVIEPDDRMIWVSEPSLARDGRRLQVVSHLAAPKGSGAEFDPSKLRVTLLSTQDAVELVGCD